jgi:hypothetical protein
VNINILQDINDLLYLVQWLFIWDNPDEGKTYLYSSAQKYSAVLHITTWNATQFYVYHIDHKPHIIM